MYYNKCFSFCRGKSVLDLLRVLTCQPEIPEKQVAPSGRAAELIQSFQDEGYSSAAATEVLSIHLWKKAHFNTNELINLKANICMFLDFCKLWYIAVNCFFYLLLTISGDKTVGRIYRCEHDNCLWVISDGKTGKYSKSLYRLMYLSYLKVVNISKVCLMWTRTFLMWILVW